MIALEILRERLEIELREMQQLEDQISRNQGNWKMTKAAIQDLQTAIAFFEKGLKQSENDLDTKCGAV